MQVHARRCIRLEECLSDRAGGRKNSCATTCVKIHATLRPYYACIRADCAFPESKGHASFVIHLRCSNDIDVR
jgi:hypothetical protein